MPIWNEENDKIDFSIILEALEHLDFSGAVGFPRFPYSRAATVELDGTRSQIIPSTSNVIREVFIRNTTEQPLILFLGTQEIKADEISAGQHWWDTFNSGLPIEAIGSGVIEIIIRQDKVINYAIGADMVFPVGIKLLIGTGANFGFITAGFQDSPSSIFDQNVSKLFNSNDEITGHKVALVSCFTPGASIDFTVQTAGTRYDTSQAIQFQYINLVSALRLAYAVGSDVMNPESELLGDGIGGLLTQGGFAGEVPGTGGTLTLAPDNFNYFGRFVAVNVNDGYYDTAIITSYTPNSDPLKGGTFTLEGF